MDLAGVVSLFLEKRMYLYKEDDNILVVEVPWTGLGLAGDVISATEIRGPWLPWTTISVHHTYMQLQSSLGIHQSLAFADKMLFYQ